MPPGPAPGPSSPLPAGRPTGNARASLQRLFLSFWHGPLQESFPIPASKAKFVFLGPADVLGHIILRVGKCPVIAGRLPSPWVCTLWMSVAPFHPLTSPCCDNQKYYRTLPDIFWGRGSRRQHHLWSRPTILSQAQGNWYADPRRTVLFVNSDYSS